MEGVTMSPELGSEIAGQSFNRRRLLGWAGAMAAASNLAANTVGAQPLSNATGPAKALQRGTVGALQRGMIGYMLAHEQFPVPQLLEIGATAARAGFQL